MIMYIDILLSSDIIKLEQKKNEGSVIFSFSHVNSIFFVDSYLTLPPVTGHVYFYPCYRIIFLTQTYFQMCVYDLIELNTYN